MIASLILLLSAAALRPGAVERLPPVDQCAADADFAAFRTTLNGAIARRDHAFILSILPEDILVNFGGDRGRDSFARQWRLDQAGSPFWDEIRTVLSLGCRVVENDFVAPALTTQLGEDEGPFDVVVAVRSGAVMRAAANDASAVVATLDWDVLHMRPVETDEAWMALRLKDGREGFVRRADVRSPLDYRAYFARENGRWRMTHFIAGD